MRVDHSDGSHDSYNGGICCDLNHAPLHGSVALLVCLVGVVSVQSHSVLADHALVFCNFARGQGDEAKLKHFLWVRAPFLENVLGFARADPLPHTVPVQAFLNMLELVRREDTPTTLTTSRCTSSRFPRGAWANLSRPRTLAFLHSR